MIESTAVIIDLDGDRQFHELNETASLVWSHCDGKHSIDDLSQVLAEEYEVDAREARTDTETLVAEFSQKNLLA